MANLISMAVLEEIQTAVEPHWQEFEESESVEHIDRRMNVQTAVGRIDVWLHWTEHGYVTDVPLEIDGWTLAWHSYYREGWSEPDSGDIFLRLYRNR